MGAAASARHFRLPSTSGVVLEEAVDLSTSSKLHSLRLILNSEQFSHFFEDFLEVVEPAKILFVKFYLELERLKAMCFMAMLDKKQRVVMTIGDSLQTVRDIVLNSSAKIYLLSHPCRRIHDKQKNVLKEFHYERIVARCLSSLLSSTALLSEVGLQGYHEMLEDCQTNLLMELLEELSDFIISPVFLQLQTCSNNAAVRNTFAEIVHYTTEASDDNIEEGVDECSISTKNTSASSVSPDFICTVST